MQSLLTIRVLKDGKVDFLSVRIYGNYDKLVEFMDYLSKNGLKLKYFWREIMIVGIDETYRNNRKDVKNIKVYNNCISTLREFRWA